MIGNNFAFFMYIVGNLNIFIAGMPQQRLAHFMLTFLDKWNLFVMSSADASETAVIAKNRKTVRLI